MSTSYNVGETAVYSDLSPFERVEILAVNTIGEGFYDIKFEDGFILTDIHGDTYMRKFDSTLLA